MKNKNLAEVSNPRRICLVSFDHGPFIPQQFIESYDREEWHLDRLENPDRTLSIIECGPTHPDYIQAWDEILEVAYMIDGEGDKWTLLEENDLFMVTDWH